MGKIRFGESEESNIEVVQEVQANSPIIEKEVITVEKIVEVPVEVIKEIEVIKEVEVVKEIEVIREIEKIVEIPIIKVQERLIEDTSKIEELTITIKDLDLNVENIRLYNIKLKAELKKQVMYKWIAIVMIGVALCL